MQMIIWRDLPLTNDHPPPPRHPNHLSKDPDSISRTFLEQFALVFLATGVQVYIPSHINPIKTLRQFEVVKISFQRWKAMMMDREETEEEVYMPTHKVFGLSQPVTF